MDIVRGKAVIGIGRGQNGDNGQAARIENDAGEVALCGRVRFGKPPDEQRQDEVVGDHDRQRHAGDNHHCRGCR